MVEGSPPHGSKLPYHYENPLDWLLIKALVPMMPALHALGITPNMLTAASALCAAASLYCMVKGEIGCALLLWGLNYMFDLADGLKARLFDQQSYLGCTWDHYTDILSVVGLYGVIAWRMRAGGRGWWPLVVEVFVLLVSWTHFQCQERYSQGRTSMYIPVTGVDIKKCKNVDVMRWTRWFGVATLTAWHMFLIAYYGS